jgi:photosystem II stability/assembly factor-like uncharacterized protein
MNTYQLPAKVLHYGSAFILLFYIFLLFPGISTAAWISIHTAANTDCQAVHFPVDAQTGYIAGDYSKVLKTDNGGEAWRDISFNNTSAFEAVQFPVDNLTGYVVGYNPEAYKTTDGGESWTSVFPPADKIYAAFHTVCFPADNQTGYAAGPGQDVYKTTDGGNTWIWQFAPCWIIRSIHFPVDADTGYAVGSDGQILKTTDGGGTFIEEEVGNHIFAGSVVQPNPFTSHTCLIGHEQERFDVWDIAGRKAGVYSGNRIGFDLAPGIYFVDRKDIFEKPAIIVKVR